MLSLNLTIEEQATEHLQQLIKLVDDAFHQSTPAHRVEQSLFRKLMELGHDLMVQFFARHGTGDQGESVALSNGRCVKRLPDAMKRNYLSIFGEFELLRTVYGSRAGQKIEYIPLDVRLQLPNHKFSYLLQDWDQSLATEMPYAKVNETIRKILNLPQSVNSLERLNQHLASSAPLFWDQRVKAPPAESDQLVVLSTDCKGVVIRKSAEEKAAYLEENPPEPASLKSNSPKANGRKKMAVLGAAYTIEPHIRTPESVLESLFRPPQETRPKNSIPRIKPLYKHIRASMLRDTEDTLLPARQEIFKWLQRESNDRRRKKQGKTILLSDGEKALSDCKAYLPKDTVQILDLLHACSYMWDALHVLYPTEKTASLIPIAKEQVGKILNGKVKNVIKGFRNQGTRRKLSTKRRADLEKACRYLENNVHRMHYDEYLEKGYPIASGVIEGACRHLICDRMECTGMRWVMDGATSMLKLRCLVINGSWDEFMKFHIEKEQQSKFPVQAANQDIFSEAMLG